MYTCRDCGAQFTTHSNFCSKCGGSNIVNDTPIQPQPQTYAPAYQAPQYVETKPEDKGKGNAIVGFVFGLISLFMTFLIYAITEDIAYSSYYYYDEAFYSAFFVFILIFQMPFSIVGLVNSAKARTLRGLSIPGLVISIFGLVVVMWSAIMFLSVL